MNCQFYLMYLLFSTTIVSHRSQDFVSLRIAEVPLLNLSHVHFILGKREMTFSSEPCFPRSRCAFPPTGGASLERVKLVVGNVSPSHLSTLDGSSLGYLVPSHQNENNLRKRCCVHEIFTSLIKHRISNTTFGSRFLVYQN